MKRTKLILLLMCMLVLGSMTVIAADDTQKFTFHILSDNAGYNSESPITKYAGYTHAYIEVTDVDNDILWQWGTSRTTNFIVIASNGVQITDAVALAQDDYAYSRFYSEDHAGAVYLRGNSTATGINYEVHGIWSPNDIPKE